MKDKIFVYRRNAKGVLHLIEEYNSSDAFARRYYDGKVKDEFGDNDIDHVNITIKAFGDSWSVKIYAKVAYNSKDKLLPVSQLVGYTRRRVRKTWRDKWINSRQGRKKDAYGTFRYIRTTQERCWAHAWDDEEFCPSPRASRQGHNLPDAWDDYWAHSEKNWKMQSKRKHQWK